jgi:tetratricopeptide (TPR) repeat protein
MNTLQSRLDDLRRQLRALGDEPDPDALSDLEKAARALLSDAKNTPYEPAAQALFAEMARSGNATSPAAATIRGLVRRARIRLEIAGDDDDIDEAIDILAEGLALNPRDPDVIQLLTESAGRSPHAGQRVTDLFNRYGVQKPAAKVTPPPTPAVPSRPITTKIPPLDSAGTYPTSAGYPPPEAQPGLTDTQGRRAGRGPMYQSPDIDDLQAELTQAYYAGEYQQTIDFANRILTQQPGNPTALDYRQKAEDNLIRGVVPDHRIPFDARVSYNRANSLVRAGNYEEAERLYREARDLAERSGILSWKDAEQALLDIQDLALARELMADGDRLLKADNWAEALRKYEGALRVVPNDPVAEERIELVRRIQQDTDQLSVQMSMLSGPLSEQVAQLQNVLNLLMRVRQLLPDSQRLGQLNQNAQNRLTGIKTQLNDQAQSALNRAGNSNRLDERLSLSNEALQLIELGVKLDPADSAQADLLINTRASVSDMQRARQVIERAAALVAQNFDNELAQARTMLAGLREYAQDERYRNVVSDLLGRYLERAEFAVEEGKATEATSWLETLREEPFRVLGRRTEVQRLESAIRSLKQRRTITLTGIVAGIATLGLVTLVATQGVWSPILFPPPTATATATFTPSVTPLPSDTPTPSNTPTPTSTYTPTATASVTWTPSPTITPSFTVTPSWTPSATLTPTHTLTPTPTFTPSLTTTPTNTSVPSPTPTELCRVTRLDQTSARVRSGPSTANPQVADFPQGTVGSVLEVRASLDDSTVWYLIVADIGGPSGAQIRGWVRSDAVVQVTSCPTTD